MFTLLSSTVRQVTPCQNDDAYCSLATVIGSGATTAIGPLALAVHSSDSTGQLRLMTRRLPVPNAGSADDIRLEEFGVVNTPPRERLRCVSGLCLANGTMPENAKLAAQECRTSTPDQYAALRSSSRLGERLSSEHLRLISIVDQCRSVADRLDQLGPEERIVQVRRLYEAVNDRLLRHESVEETRLYPRMAQLPGGEDPTGTMSRAHVCTGRARKPRRRRIEPSTVPSAPGNASQPRSWTAPRTPGESRERHLCQRPTKRGRPQGCVRLGSARWEDDQDATAQRTGRILPLLRDACQPYAGLGDHDL